MKRSTQFIIGITIIVAVFILGDFAVHQMIRITHLSSPEVGDEVIVSFPKWISPSRAEQSFHIYPSIPGSFTWLKEYNELHFVPHEGFKPNITYHITVKIPLPGLALTLPVANTRPIYVSKALNNNGLVSPPILLDQKYIDANLETMTLTLYNQGKIEAVYPIAGKGNPDTVPTIEGNFSIKTKEQMHLSSLTHVWMPWSMQFEGNFFIHEWPYWPDGERVKARYSAGCIRLHEGHSQEVFEYARIGMPLIVHSTPTTSVNTIEDGDLVREEENSDIYTVSHIGEKRFKRRIFMEKTGEWYPHLAPLWDNVKVVPKNSLAHYTTSRWIRGNKPNKNGVWDIYEIDNEWKKHRMRCGGFRDCNRAWRVYGWDPDEIYTVVDEELAHYEKGDTIPLIPAPHAF